MKNILILDDNKDILKALHVGLCTCLKDCEIQTALNGEAGMAILKARQIDLILTDLDMPALNRCRFIEQARQEYPSVPVCVMSENCTPEIKERLGSLGVTRFIQRPFRFEKLASLITEELKLEERTPRPGEYGNA